MDEDYTGANKKSCKSLLSSLELSQDSTPQVANITQDDEEVSSLRQTHSPVNEDKYNSSEYQLEKQEWDKKEEEKLNEVILGFEEETAQAAHNLHYNTTYKAYRVPNFAMISALSEVNIPPRILNNGTLVELLHEKVRQKMKKLEPRNSAEYKQKKIKGRSDKSDDDPPKSKEERITEATQLANRMECEDERGKGIFQAHVCIACDRHIIGTEEICYLTKVQLTKNTHRIGVKSYDEFYHEKYNYPKLHPELVKQYKVDDMEGLLLSQRSQYSSLHGGYETCKSCFDSLKKSSTKSPPKHAIANGFVIGYIPREVFLDPKTGKMRPMNDVLCAMLAPTRAYGYTFSYFGGAQQSIQGHYMFYEVNQTHVGSVVNNIHNTGANPHIHVVLGGRYTPRQKEIVRRIAEVDTKLYTDIMTWFINVSGHKGYDGVPIPSECPRPYISIETPNDVDDEVDKDTEKQFDGGTYYFSSANAPSSDTGVYDTCLKFTQSLLNSAPPQLLVYGGDYKGGHDLLLENVIPTAFLTYCKETRLDFPGACSLNFEGVMQIILSELLAWDSDKQEGSEDGIAGELDAWGMAVEEQARKTLHSHWLLWSKRLAKMRNDLFDDDGNMNETARKKFCARIDQVMSSSYTDNEWTVEHKCGARGKVDEVFKECKLQVLRDARHKVLCHDLCGKVMECNECHEKVSTQNIINLALNEWHQNAIKDDETSAKNLTFPLSKERLDMQCIVQHMIRRAVAIKMISFGAMKMLEGYFSYQVTTNIMHYMVRDASRRM